MTATGQVIGAGTAFAWLGMVLAISFLETPLKFRAPGITLPLGLGIGRLVFRALNTTEITLAAALLAALLTYRPGVAGWALLGITGALLATQTGLLRPRLDRRAGQIITGQTPPPSGLHLAYIALEILKVAALVALGTLLITDP
jgi:hypothetical protein